jgi:hypothetical protein
MTKVVNAKEDSVVEIPLSHLADKRRELYLGRGWMSLLLRIPPPLFLQPIITSLTLCPFLGSPQINLIIIRREKYEVC